MTKLRCCSTRAAPYQANERETSPMAETTDAHDVDDRIERERRFHDQDFEHKTRNETVDKYYTVAKESFVWFDRLLGEIPAGASVLEYGCGEGSHVFDLAGSASVTGIDL